MYLQDKHQIILTCSTINLKKKLKNLSTRKIPTERRDTIRRASILCKRSSSTNVSNMNFTFMYVLILIPSIRWVDSLVFSPSCCMHEYRVTSVVCGESLIAVYVRYFSYSLVLSIFPYLCDPLALVVDWFYLPCSSPFPLPSADRIRHPMSVDCGGWNFYQYEKSYTNTNQCKSIVTGARFELLLYTA